MSIIQEGSDHQINSEELCRSSHDGEEPAAQPLISEPANQENAAFYQNKTVRVVGGAPEDAFEADYTYGQPIVAKSREHAEQALRRQVKTNERVRQELLKRLNANKNKI